MLEIATLWLVTKERELLLQKRSLTKRLHPGEWGPSLTGTMEEGETPDQTLTREVREELGLDPTDYSPKFLFTKDFDHPDGKVRRFHIYYALVEKSITEKMRIDVTEVAEVRWFTIEELRNFLNNGSDEYTIVPSAKDVWPETFEILGKELQS